jgi:DNA-binding PadR family transcriptional regulator
MADSNVPRLSSKERLILGLLLASHEREMYGLQLVSEADGRLARGTVYVLLDRMEEKGLVESRQEVRAANASGMARRLYRATGLGATVYRLWEQFEALAAQQLTPRLA